MKKIIVIGGGAAGMMAAISAAELSKNIILLEKTNFLGKKLSITGKGRCNITNFADIPEIIKNILGNGRFLNSVLKNFDSNDTINFFESLGVKTKIERGNRVFPMSDNAKEVVDALINKMINLGVDIRTNARVTKIITTDKKITGVEINNKIESADAVILATGGASYPATGSTGDGFKLAKQVGHTITKILPALVPLETEEEFVKDLQGLSLKNVRVTLFADNKKIADEFGEMLFTHFGVSGPIILSLSRQVSFLLSENKFVELSINLKPALTPEQLSARVLRDFEKFKRKSAKNALVDLLPSKLISVILDLAFIDEEKHIDSITQAERRRLIEILRDLRLTITKTRSIEEAIVTAGGISTKEINPKTMESKIISGLFFAGEVVDVDGFTGGFNLQAAFAMANAAGKFSCT
ncbi:MAG: NAD(P)/FAD-dependent oxidoreductase [Selenomonadaceae bacterium]|nr:NAD(P)/FAD-dependent oxidoreductase [Selenomonadaceae bacterium]